MAAEFELGRSLLETDPLAALKAFNRALQLEPDSASSLCGIAAALDRLGEQAMAGRALRMAAALAPQHLPAWLIFGERARRSGRVADSIRDFARALALDPNRIEALDSFVWCCQVAGDVEAAARAARAAHETRPERADLHAQLILALLPLAAVDQKAILDECRAWDRSFAAPLSRGGLPLDNDRDPERRLRVGYVGAQGFRSHTMGVTLLPLIEAHDPAKVELVCYSDLTPEREDWVTQAMRARTPLWRDSSGLSDAALAKQIRTDRVDVLVDVFGYPPGSRLAALARRPAPVQVNGLPMNSFGMEAVEWVIADERLTPPGCEAWFTETIARVPLSFCYRPLVPPPAPQPRLGQPLMFGSFNQPGKLSEHTLRAWGLILRRLPDAGLMLKAAGFADPELRLRFERRALRLGLPVDRLVLRPWSPSPAAHLETYNEIDIALDPFPYCGVITTCEALSMGVPVVSLAGDRVIGRYGASLLGAVGLEHLVGGTSEAYVDVAVELARDRQALALLRAQLRDRFSRSPICDGVAYARSLEQAYRTMWRDWCCRR
jgi:protein O-GlcNAc transferase